jgi:hypothetical protein
MSNCFEECKILRSKPLTFEKCAKKLERFLNDQEIQQSLNLGVEVVTHLQAIVRELKDSDNLPQPLKK